MYCKNCGVKNEDGARFCEGCGTKIQAGAESNRAEGVEATQISSDSAAPSNVTEDKSVAMIKCGNCGYIGPGEPARSMVAKILAWICVVFAPLITIIYFVATHKYKCPKCGSTFLGIRNKKGEFTKGQSTASRVVIIIVAIFVGIAIIGILSAVVLASLNTARSKGNDAAIQSYLSTIQVEAEIYYGGRGDNSYGGRAFSCTSGMFYSDSTIANAIVSINELNGSVQCVSITTPTSAYAVQASLSYQSGDSQEYACIDSMGNNTISTVSLGADAVCP